MSADELTERQIPGEHALSCQCLIRANAMLEGVWLKSKSRNRKNLHGSMPGSTVQVILGACRKNRLILGPTVLKWNTALSSDRRIPSI